MSADTATFVNQLGDRTSWRAEKCPAGRAMEIVGTRSAVLILREAYFGTTRFEEFAQRVGMTEGVAAARLRELTEAGLLERHPYRENGQRTRHEYRLTPMGRDLVPVVLGLYRWGEKYLLADGQPSPVILTHADCGAAIQVEVTCAEGHQIPLDEVVVSPSRPRR